MEMFCSLLLIAVSTLFAGEVGPQEADPPALPSPADSEPRDADSQTASSESTGHPTPVEDAFTEPPELLKEVGPSFRKVGILLIGGCALVYGLLFLYKRHLGTKGRRPGGRHPIRISDTVPLGGKRYLCTVETLGRTLLLGISGDRIQLLTESHPEERFDETLERMSMAESSGEPGS